MNKRVVPKKNYYILAVLIVGVVIITFSVVSICNAVRNSNINSGYINKYVSEIGYNEIDTYLVEPASNTFIYLTYTGDKSIYKLEKNLMKLINNYELQSNFIYIDVTEEMVDNHFIRELNDKLEISVTKLPIIIYYKDGVLTGVVTSEENLFNVADFQKLLDNYELAS